MTRWLQRLHHHDLQLLLWFGQAPRRDWWIACSRAISRSGDGWVQLALPPLLWLADPVAGRTLCMAALVAFAIERPVYWVLKNCCQRRRPPEAIPSFRSVIHASDRFSFPSGHTAAAFLLASLVAISHGLVALPLFFWAAAVALSRVILGVHFPSDTLAGALLGIGIAWLTFCWLLV